MFKSHNNKNLDNGKKNNDSDKTEITKSLEQNIKLIKSIFNEDQTLIVRKFQNKYLDSAKCCVLYINGMVNTEIINENIIQPVLQNNLNEGISSVNLLKDLQYKIIVSNDIKESTDINEIVGSIIYGDTVFLLDGHDKALIISSKGWQTRAVDEPDAEKVVRGPREGFVESIMVNLSLIRRKLKTPDLKFTFKEMGARSHTKICICFIEGLASPKIIDELYKRLEKVDIDGILDSGYIQEMIKDSPFSPFKTIYNTERPDVVAAKLLEGRIAVVVDGTPAVLVLPYVFMEYFQANEDYYNNYYFASINRLLRVISAFITISVPAIYVALVNFHQEMIPSPLLLSISAARQGIPFPTIIEAIGLLLVFEILRETGTRMPTTIGQAVNIVGALVIGQAAVEARFVSAPMVIVIALTGITGLLLPKLKGASIIIRLILLLLAAVLGFYGYILGIIGLLLSLFSMRSFGIPYMLNFGSINPQDLKDTVIRAPWWYMYHRPKLIAAKNSIRKKYSKVKGH